MRNSTEGVLTIITGGSACGKSEYGEYLATKHNGKRIYVATMYPYDKESKVRIKKHQCMRKDKGFDTVECYMDIDCSLSVIDADDDAVLLIECMSNLIANEMFMSGGCLNGIRDYGSLKQHADVEIINPIVSYLEHFSEIIVITNDVFMDCGSYDLMITNYIDLLAYVNSSISAKADRVIEVICSIPVLLKGEAK